MAVILICVGYALGAVPFALIISKFVGGSDVRYRGSGNVGAANVLRTTNVSLAAFVMALDMAKGAVTVSLALCLGLSVTVAAVAGVASVVGHVFPVWLKFRGGKGVATACGVFVVLAPQATIVASGVFVFTVWITRYVSVGSMIGSLILPVAAYFTDTPPPAVVAAIGVATLILYRHRANVERLQTGREWRLGQRV